MYPIDNPKFSRDINPDFSKTLRKRVNYYFKSNNINRNANANMVAKTVFMLTLFFMPLFNELNTPSNIFFIFI